MMDLAFVHDAAVAQRGLVSRAARWAGSAVMAAGLLAGSNAALAANADLRVTVTPIPNITLSDGTFVSSAVSLSRITATSVFNAYLAVDVTVTSQTTNTNNAVVFSSQVKVDPGASPPGVPTVVGTACLPGSTFSETQITCNIGQMKGGTSVNFTVIFRTPTDGTNIDFPWNLSYSTLGSQGSTPSGTDFSGDVSTALITAPPQDVSTKFTTFVPPGQSSAFFTGNANGTATSITPADTLTTKVRVPSDLVGLSTISVLNDPPVTGGLTGDTLTTNTTHIQAPYKDSLGGAAYFNTPIFFELRRDSSTIKSFNQIGRAVIYYKSELGELYQTTGQYGEQLSNCDPITGLPTTAVPLCISDRQPLSKKTLPNVYVPNPTSDDYGDWLIVVKAWQNGIARW